jgi:hypothetical protein
MPEAVAFEVVRFLVNLARATRGGQVAWDQQTAAILTAELGGGYAVKLELVADGFEDARSEGPQPDHILSLSRHGTVVVPRIDRRTVDHQVLARQSEQPPSAAPAPYGFFVWLWVLAESNAQKATGHLQAVNRILEPLNQS